MGNIQDIVTITLGVGGIIGMVITVYKSTTDRNIDQDKTIIKMESKINMNECNIRDVSKKIDKVDRKIDKIMHNHLSHIESSIVRLETIVDGLVKKIGL